MKILLTDCDEVLLNWKSEFEQFIFEDTPYRPTSSWSYHKLGEWLNVTPTEVYKLVTDFNSSERFGNLKPYPLAAEWLQKMYNDNWEIVVITSCGADPLTKELRHSNLINHFGNIFSTIHCLDHSEIKLDYLTMYNPTIWVEDQIGGAMAGVEAGHKTFIVDHPHNQQLTDNRIIRIFNLPELDKYLFKGDTI